ncbi:MAG: hypothetical protein ACREDR_17720 [Blastocatellia bacterium]
MAATRNRRTEITIETNRVLIVRIPGDSKEGGPAGGRQPYCGAAPGLAPSDPIESLDGGGTGTDLSRLFEERDLPLLDAGAAIAFPSRGIETGHPGAGSQIEFQPTAPKRFARVVRSGLAGAPELQLFVLSVWCVCSAGLLRSRNFTGAPAIGALALALASVEIAALVIAMIKSTKSN